MHLTPGMPASRRDALARLVGLAALTSLPAGAHGAQRHMAPADGAAPDIPNELLRQLRASGVPLGHWGIEVQAVHTGETLLSLNPQQTVPLASTAKLVTSAAALDLLGPTFTWKTQVYLDGDLQDGTLHGDLVVVGGGDPTLRTEQLRAWLQDMRAAGLRRIRGDIVLDRSVFRLRQEDHDSTPAPGPDRPHHVHPNALSLDQGVVQLALRRRPGAPPRLDASVPLADPQLLQLGSPAASAEGCALQPRWADPLRTTPSAPSHQHLRVETPPDSACQPPPVAAVLPPGSDLFAQVVGGLWRSVGGRLQGRVRQGAALRQGDGLRLPRLLRDGTPQSPWMTLRSAPLVEVMRDINKHSDNLAARHLMLALSPGFPARAATLPDAQSRVTRWLLQQGITPDALSLDSGSGLSRGDRGQARALVRLLRSAAFGPHSRDFVTSLPVAGMDGTLSNRFEGGPARGNALLKTGSLLDARALAGYVMTRQGTVCAVAMLVNHPRAELARPALDQLVEWVVRHG
ncbi:MAG: D-alanyl-D-alanine carboxypeptidase [Rubrivivax sp.]|jgi:D-alanyl-D-alanine carboxypeptidase/D-alanyl-D-alanine-endopeptidase (penicillin-binding protein 4)|nr:D-alanyl-D-alanine carboxypeptidase [Rubrivivax sp.]